MVVLNRDEQKTLGEAICMLQVISMMGNNAELLPRLVREIGDREPVAGMAILSVMHQLEHPREELELVGAECFREFLTDALINVGQLHSELKGKVYEYSKLEPEVMRERREWLAVECAAELIEPKTLEKLKPVMVKLRGNV